MTAPPVRKRAGDVAAASLTDTSDQADDTTASVTPAQLQYDASITISMVKDCRHTETVDVTLWGFINGIRKGRWRWENHIQRIRDLVLDGKTEEAAKFKQALPAITPSGRFTERKNEALIQHSGIIVADLDKLGNKLSQIRRKVERLPKVVAVFLSPSATGLKVFVRVRPDPHLHLRSFGAVEKLILDRTGIQIDQSGKDVSRLCYVSFDPDVYYNEYATELRPLPEPETPKRSTAPPCSEKPNKAQIREMLAYIPKRPHYHEWIRVVSAVGDALSEEDAIDVLIEWSAEEQRGEYADKLRHRLEDVHIGTLVHLAKQHGWSPNKKTTSSRIELQSEDDAAPVELPAAPAPYVAPPLDLLPPILRDYIQASAASLDVSESYVFQPLLSTLAAHVGNSRSVLLKTGYVEPSVIWTGIIGPTGSLKSPAIASGCLASMEVEREFRRQNKEAHERYEDEIAEWRECE